MVVIPYVQLIFDTECVKEKEEKEEKKKETLMIQTNIISRHFSLELKLLKFIQLIKMIYLYNLYIYSIN